MRCVFLSVALLVLVTATIELESQGWAEVVSVGSGSYRKPLPAGESGPSDDHGNPVLPLRTASVTGPMPTNDWWTPLAWARRAGNPDSLYSENMYAHPLCFRASSRGLDLQYPTVCATWTEYHLAPWGGAFDLTAGLAGLSSPDSKVGGYSDWTVLAYWDDGMRWLRATLGHGLPFAYFTCSGADAEITLNEVTGEYRIWHSINGTLGVTVRGHHYGIFGPTGCTWSQAGNTLRSNLGGKDYFSIAILPDVDAADLEAALAVYRQHAFAFVVDTRVSWAYDQARSSLTTTYSLTTTAKEGSTYDTLIALYRHQWLHTADALTAYTYVSPRGRMKVRAGTSFSTVMAFNGVLPSLPNAVTDDTVKSRLYEYVDQVYREGDLAPLAYDTYWWGKELGRAAALVSIADQIGHFEARDHLLADMKRVLENWFTADPDETANLFCYEDSWGTLIGFLSSYNTDMELNDHHFHYGYFVISAATIARYDPDWATDARWGGMVKMLIRDVASPDRNDALFPWLRYFDPYAGHSWASGHGVDHEGYRGNNQESSSESMNFSAGLILFGAATGDTALRDLGIFMYVNELHAIQQYWFDVDQAVFCPGFAHPVLGILWSSGGYYGTWWTTNPEEIHGINFLPITGASLYLGYRPDYMLRNYSHMVTQNDGNAAQQWKDIIWSYYALRDASQAIAWFDADPSYEPEAGETKAHTYHWIQTLNAMGSPDTSVTADSPTHALFIKNGHRTYVGYNPARAPTTITFSDGMTLDLEGGELRAAKIHRADFDHDGDADQDDLAIFELCSTGPAVPYGPGSLPQDCHLPPDALGFVSADFDEDHDVDQTDFGVFQRRLSGPDIAAELHCAERYDDMLRAP